jgi:hypothetical protein
MPAEYNEDFYAWTQETAKALAEGRTEGVDLRRVAEEIEDMGKSERHALESHFRRILVHILRLEYQPVKRTRSWTLSIAESRLRIRKRLEESPSLRASLPELLATAYEEAHLRTALETELEPEAFPEQCPYSLDDVLQQQA